MDRRPIYLNFLTLRFPITAVVSFLHRVSGFFIFLFIPLLLWILQKSLSSESDFELLKVSFTSNQFKFFIFLLSAAIIYHLFAGFRHLLMDIHIGESKIAGKIGAYIVLLFSFILIILFGGWIW